MFGFFKKPVEAPVEVKKEEEVQPTITVPVICDCATRQLEYVNNVDRLTKEITKLQADKLKATEDLEKARLDHKITIEDIKHMQKLLDEKNQLALERKVFEAEKNVRKEVDKIKDEYKEKLELDLIKRQDEINALYQKIMEALPNVNVKLQGKV